MASEQSPDERRRHLVRRDPHRREAQRLGGIATLVRGHDAREQAVRVLARRARERWRGAGCAERRLDGSGVIALRQHRRDEDRRTISLRCRNCRLNLVNSHKRTNTIMHGNDLSSRSPNRHQAALH